MVFLYGPPAVGKLTVGRVVAERLGFRLLHNHVTVDPVAAVFDFGTRPFFDVLGRLRRDLFSTAAREGVDLVVTFVIAPGEERLVDELVAGFDVTYVRLVARPEELRRRVVLDSRRTHGKIADAAVLDELLAKWDLDAALPGRAALTVDTEQLSPDEAAAQIVRAVGGDRRRGQGAGRRRRKSG
jgi:broad-specificity NMP kinase